MKGQKIVLYKRINVIESGAQITKKQQTERWYHNLPSIIGNKNLHVNQFFYTFTTQVFDWRIEMVMHIDLFCLQFLAMVVKDLKNALLLSNRRTHLLAENRY